MPEKNLAFQSYLENEVKSVKGVYVPVRAGVLRRLLIRRAACKKFHPNPEDEFCSPAIGPNVGIINQYAKDFRAHGTYASAGHDVEPLIVEKIRPDGYLILNGHHRWAAAILSQQRSLPIQIMDLPQEADIKKMILNSRSDRRVTLDLDEVVFCSDSHDTAEKPLPFPLRLHYKQRLRLGIPALFHFFNEKGYDIWVYSANYHSFKHIHKLFMLYRTHVTGIVTGTARKGPLNAAIREKLQRNIKEHYATTLHIDRNGMQRVDSRTGDYEEYTFDDPEAPWSVQIMELIGALEKHE